MMPTPSAVRPALEAAVTRLLRPLVRLMLRHAMPFGAFEELAKKVYVEVAYQEFGIPGKKPSVSRASILTGLTRKEAQRLLSADGERDAEGGERYNRAARVLTGWVRDPDFRDGRGRPRPLEVDSPTGFAGLVRRHSGDMPVRAVLDELVRVGAVQQRDDGRVELLTRAYVPQASAVDKLGILGSDVADLVTTIDHNLQQGEADPRFQRKVMYHRMPADVLPAFREVSAAHAQQLLERMDHWLAARDVSGPPASPHARVGLGIYYFEEPVSDDDTPAGAKR